MLKKVLIVTFFLFGLGISSPSWSILISGTEVGLIDTFEGSINKNDLKTQCGPGGSTLVEKCWADNVLGMDLTLSSTLETAVSYIREGDKIAFGLVSGPGYYIVKNSTEWALMKNEVDINWGVLDLSISGLSNFKGTLGSDLQISHVTEFNGVPEPVSLLLFGTGLLGFGLVRRRQRKNF